MSRVSLKTIAIIAGLSAAPAAAQESAPTTPQFPSPDQIATMSYDDLKLEYSKLTCFKKLGTFDSMEEMLSYLADEAQYQAKVTAALNAEISAFTDKVLSEDFPTYFNIFKQDPTFDGSIVTPEDMARVAVNIQMNVGSKYPKATCSKDYQDSPFPEQKTVIDLFNKFADSVDFNDISRAPINALYQSIIAAEAGWRHYKI